MRIALLTPAYGSAEGIVGRHVEALANGIALAGASVEVFVQGGRDRPRFPEEHDRIRVGRFPAAPLGRGYGALWSALRRRADEFEVLHAHGEAVLAEVAALQAEDVPFVFTPHHYASSQWHLRHLVQGRRQHLARQVLRSADRVLCVSTSEALQVARYAPTANVEIVPSGIDGHEVAAAHPFDVPGRLIVTVDRLTKWAGIHRVISALPALGPDYSVAVIGQGRSRGALERHAHYLGVADRVSFLGAVSDLALHRWLRTASVVATLKEESLWGVTLLNSVAAGAPVVASDILAHREAAAAVGQEGISFVSRRASPFVVAEAIRVQADARSCPRPELVPNWEQTVEQVLAAYEEVLAYARRAVRAD